MDSSCMDEEIFLTFEEFVAGWLGGISGLVASHPIDTIKVRQQYGGDRITQTIITTFRYEGIRGFYKGIGFPCMMAGIQNAIFFGVYANTSRTIKLAEEQFTIPNEELIKIVLSGNCAGMVQVLATTPVEIIKIRLQTRKDTSFHEPNWKIFRNIGYIYKVQGIFGFYHGFLPTAMRYPKFGQGVSIPLQNVLFNDVPTGGLYMLIYVHCDKYMQEYVSHWWSHLISGGLAGALSYAPVTPFDVMKTRIQADDPEAPKYHGFTDCVKKSYKKQGLSCFWRGFITSSLRSFICNATVFIMYECILKILPT